LWIQGGSIGGKTKNTDSYWNQGVSRATWIESRKLVAGGCGDCYDQGEGTERGGYLLKCVVVYVWGEGEIRRSYGKRLEGKKAATRKEAGGKFCMLIHDGVGGEAERGFSGGGGTGVKEWGGRKKRARSCKLVVRSEENRDCYGVCDRNFGWGKRNWRGELEGTCREEKKKKRNIDMCSS